MTRQISVIGFDEEHCTEKARTVAYGVGREVAKAGAVLITGGLGGVMEAACKGAKSENGLTVGIVPSDNREQANKFCDVVVATGVGYTRNFFVAYSGDAVVIVGGGAGTLIEASAAYQKKKVIVAVKGSGGVADRLANQYIDDRRSVKVISAKSHSEAVRKALTALALSA